MQKPVKSEKMEYNTEPGTNLEVNWSTNLVGGMKNIDFSMHLYYNMVEYFKKGRTNSHNEYLTLLQINKAQSQDFLFWEESIDH